MWNERESIAFHARRLVVAPPSALRSRMGRTHRLARTVRALVQYGFLILYALLTAQLALTLLPGGLGRVLSRMLRPATVPLINPFTRLTPEFSRFENLNTVLPILIALVVYAALHLCVRQLLSFITRPRLTRHHRLDLFQAVESEAGTLQVAPVRASSPQRYHMNP